MKKETDFFGRTICNPECPAYFTFPDGDPGCKVMLKLYMEVWDEEKGKRVPLCKIPPNFELIKIED